MNRSTIALLLSALLCCAQTIAQPVPAPTPAAPDPSAFMREPGWLGQKHFGAGEYAELEAVVASFLKSKTRTVDGRYALYLLTAQLDHWLGLWDEDMDSNMGGKLAEWREQVPDSSLEPVVAAMQVRATAWRARGTGFSSTVTEEGWRLFRDRNQRAWRILIENKKKSSALPTWYEMAIRIGSDAQVAPDTLRELFDEGIRKHPGYHPIYFSYIRDLSPRWGGSYADADEFIREQTAAKTNPDGEMLYARLYWVTDQNEAGSPSFFEDSMVSWPRMRGGFEQLMQAFPDSKWNLANFAMFACRARDATTYGKLRAQVDAGEFKKAAPDGISLEVCDARFMKQT